jgi:hypothetical protein
MKKQSPYQLASSHFPPIVENLIILLIILVVIQTALEDIAVVFDFSKQARDKLTLVSFGFDAFFTLEFLARTFISKRRNDFRLYFTEHRGWVDFLTSIPLLLLVSGPAAYLILFGSEAAGAQVGFLSVLKTAKAIRVTRILRLIRIIKVFGKIQNTDSAMTGRHLGVIATTSVLTLVFVLALTQFIPALQIGDHNSYLKKRSAEVDRIISEAKNKETLSSMLSFFAASESFTDVLQVKDPFEKVIYQSAAYEERLPFSFNAGEAIPLSSNYKVVLSFHLIDIDHAKLNLIVFLAIILTVLTLLFLYSRMFAQQISDPSFVMAKGLRYADYNLEVKIPENYQDDEVFELAAVYNEKWLPLKSRILAVKERKTEEKSALSMDDLLG